MDYAFVALLIALGVLVLDPGLFPGTAKAGLILLSVVCLIGDLTASALTARR